MTIPELYERIGGSYESAKRILPMDKLIGKFVLKFLDDKSCDRLLSGWEAKDAASVFEGAHAIKGVCANLGLNTLSEKASEIAEEFRPGNPRKLSDAEVDERVSELRALYNTTIEGIRAFAAEQ